MNTIRFPIITILCAVLLAGCNVAKEPPRVPVKGRVTMGGKPVAGATVVFENKAAAIAQTATTDEDGKYEFITYNSAGLPAASYKVAVSSGRFMLPGEEIPKVDVSKASPVPSKPKQAIPDKYAKVETSGLSADVKSGDNPSFDFELKP
jgi:hypothetical protein